MKAWIKMTIALLLASLSDTIDRLVGRSRVVAAQLADAIAAKVKAEADLATVTADLTEAEAQHMATLDVLAAVRAELDKAKADAATAGQVPPDLITKAGDLGTQLDAVFPDAVTPAPAPAEADPAN